MTKGVIYHNRGTACYIRLLVSIISLRKYYEGKIAVMQEGTLDGWMYPILKALTVSVVQLPLSEEKILLRKTSLWREMPFDYSMFLDADTLIRGPVDEFLEWTESHGFVASWFNGWRTGSRQITKRIREWEKVSPTLVEPAICYGYAINGGVQGWSRQATILSAYRDLTLKGAGAGCNRIVVDEVALQLLLPHHKHYLADHIWNTSGTFGDVERARIIHYHGRKHCKPGNSRCDLWKAQYFELLNAFPESAFALGKPWKDKRLGRFIKAFSRPRKDITIVTTVDPQYADKLKKNIRQWMQLPGFKNQQFLVFVNGFNGPQERRFLNYPNVKIVRWTYPHSSASRREFMLAAFLLGVAKHVKTRYWMKLDADCRPQRQWWEWPDYENYTIVSHRWGFTRMKGDDCSNRHWFNRLDDIFRPENPYFKRTFDPLNSRVNHGRGNSDCLPLRFNSFCHIERLEFTKRMASHLVACCDGKMAVPSQDTISWYCATIWKETIKLINMKKWFKN